MSAILTMTRDQIITGAMKLAGILAKGETPDSDDLADGGTFLNAMIKSWHIERGFQPMYFQTISFISVAAKTKYTIGEVGADITAAAPLRMPWGFIMDANNNKIPIQMLSREQFEKLTPNSAPGQPVNYYFNPLSPLAEFYPWMVPTDTSWTFVMTVERPIETLASGAQAVDVRNETFMAMMYGLAEHMAAVNGAPETTQRRIEAKAPRLLEAAMAYLEEDGSVFFQPNPQGGYFRGR